MLVLVCYDVANDDAAGARRLRRIAEACKDHGGRVQYSLFECRVGKREWVALRQRLLDEAELTKDSLRFYFLHADEEARCEHHGVRPPLDPTGPLIV